MEVLAWSTHDPEHIILTYMMVHTSKGASFRLPCTGCYKLVLHIPVLRNKELAAQRRRLSTHSRGYEKCMYNACMLVDIHSCRPLCLVPFDFVRTYSVCFGVTF